MWSCPEQIYFVLQVAKRTLILGKAKGKRKHIIATVNNWMVYTVSQLCLSDRQKSYKLI